MKIITPNGTLEGESIEAILKEHGLDCLRSADLRSADLSAADLRCADLRSADLSDANLRDANLSELTVAQTSILPDEGDIIGWKKAITLDGAPIIVKLLIPADAQRSNATGRKCRASTAQVGSAQVGRAQAVESVFFEDGTPFAYPPTPKLTRKGLALIHQRLSEQSFERVLDAEVAA